METFNRHNHCFGEMQLTGSDMTPAFLVLLCETSLHSCTTRYSDATFTYDASLSLTSVGIVASGEREPVCPALMQTWTVSTSVTCPPDRTTQMGKGKGKGKGRQECPNDPAALRGDAEITLKHNFVASAVGDATSTNEYCPRLVDTESSSATSSTGAAGLNGNTVVTVMFPAGAPIDLNNAARCAENDASTQSSFTVDWCGCTMVITKQDVTSSATAGSTRGKGMSTQCAFQYRGQSRATSRAASAKRVVAGASFATTATTTTTTVVVVAVAVVLVAGAMMLVQRRIRARNAAAMANAQVEDAVVVAAAESSDTMSNSSDTAATTTSDAFEEDAQLY